jgi:hypothetical protein
MKERGNDGKIGMMKDNSSKYKMKKKKKGN